MIRRVTALVAALAMAATAAVAQGSPPAAPDPAAVAEATTYFDSTGKAEYLHALVERMAPYVLRTLQAHGVSADDAQTLSTQDIMPDVKAAEPALRQRWIDASAALFTIDDMKALEAFYATPAGQHVLQAEVAYSVRLATEDSAWAAQALSAAIHAHEDDLKAHGYHD